MTGPASYMHVKNCFKTPLCSGYRESLLGECDRQTVTPVAIGQIVRTMLPNNDDNWKRCSRSCHPAIHMLNSTLRLLYRWQTATADM